MTMLIACIALACLLGAISVWAWHRERLWQQRFTATQRALGQAASLDDIPSLIEKLTAERAELSREEYLRRLFESLLSEIRQGVLIVDRDLNIRFANKTIAQLFGRPTIQRLRPLLDEIHDHQVVETVRLALSEGRRSVRQIRFLPSNGNGSPVGRHFLIEAAPLPAEAERGAWLMVHDITEQMLTEQIRKDFVANASHELRTPLTIIQGYIETLQDGLIDEPATARHCLAVMDKHGHRLIRIVEDMLTISRLEAAGANLNIEPFNVRACIQDAIDHLAPMLEGRTVHFEFVFPPDGGSLNGDRFYWDQVFTNLLENAIKENPGRTLTIRLTGRWVEDQCILTISDDGVGIPSHDIPFVFKRFFRGHKHHGQTIKGTGLGLSIVRRAVEAHGGSIDLQSKPGVETQFTIQVPSNLPLTPIAPPEQNEFIHAAQDHA
jgi:two-component system, OmpR family, phosphate regulon sensor histidine kinase PhoR